MEHWQIEHIRRNLPELILVTDFNASVKAFLMAENLLSKADIDQAEAKEILSGRLEKSNFIYNALIGRKLGYEKVTKALFQVHQYKAAEILLTGFEFQGFKKGLTLCGINYEQRDFANCELILNGRKRNILELFNDECLTQANAIFLENLSELEYYNAFAVKDETFVLVNDTIPARPSFYIRRSLSNRIHIEKAAFKDCCDDIFVFKCMDRFELSQLATPNYTSSSKSQLQGITCRFIYLECEDDWLEICNSSTMPTHLVKYDTIESCFILENTSGVSKILENYLSRNHRVFLTEKEVVKERLQNYPNGKGFCICDTPGMGKTSVLASIAREFGNTYKETIAVFIKLPELVENISMPNSNRKENTGLIRVFQHISPSSDAGFILFKLAQKRLLSFVLFFDGFDEVQSDKVQWVKDIFKQILTYFPNITFFVTSRPQSRQELETTLGVLAFDVMPFDQTCQIDYLVAVWSQSMPQCKKSTLEQYAKKVLIALKNTFTTSKDDIAGTPLVCQLIAEVYLKEAEKFCKHENQDFLCTPRTLCHMYKSFIFTRISCASSTISQSEMKTKVEITQIAKYAHVSYAWKMIFSNKLKPDVLKSQQDEQVIESLIFGAGLIKKCTNGSQITQEFIHRTFAEYLLAEFLAEMLVSRTNSQKDKDKCFEFVLNTVLDSKNNESFTQPVIVYFLNSILIGCDTNTITCVETRFWKCMPASIIRDKLFLACAQNYPGIFRLLMTMLSNCPDKQIQIYMSFFTDEKLFEIISTAIRFSDWQLVQNCLKSLCLVFGSDINNLLAINIGKYGRNSLLQDAVTCNQYEVVEYFLGKCDPKNQALLEKCIYRSYFLSHVSLKSRTSLLKLLLTQQDLINEAKNILVSSALHVEIIKILIESGANLKATHGSSFESKLNLVQHATNYMSPFDYHELVRFLVGECRAYFLFKKQQFWESPLSLIFERIKLLPESLNLLFNIPEIDIHQVNGIGENLLVSAVRGSKLVTLTKLIEHGVIPNTNPKNKTSLLHIAAKFGDTEMMKFLLSLGCFDPNSKDTNGDTPLHISTCGNWSTSKALIDNGANVCARNKKHETPLHHACSCGNLATLDYFLLMGADLNAVDIHGNNPGHICMDYKVVENLISAGVDVFTPNNAVDSALYKYSKLFSKDQLWEIIFLLASRQPKGRRNSSSFLHNLLERDLNISIDDLKTIITRTGFDINVKNVDGIEPIMLAAQWCDFSSLQFLVEFGANYSFQNLTGFGLLHLAAQRDNLEQINYLASFDDVINQKDIDGNTPLYSCKSIDAVKMLIEKKASVMWLNDDGDTFVHKYLRNSNSDIKELFSYLTTTEKMSKVLNIPNNDGQTAFHFCHRNERLLKEVLPYIAKVPNMDINHFDNNGDNLITSAAKSCSAETMRALIECGADFKSLNKNGQNLLQIAQANNNFSTVNYCLEIGMDPLKMDDCNRNGFWLAAEACDINVIKAMQKKGISIRLTNNKVQTLLHIATIKGNVNLIHYCLENGLNPNQKDNKGNTPFIIVASKSPYKDQLSIIQHMVKRGAKIKSKNYHGQNILHLASAKGNEALINYCHELGINFNKKDGSGNCPLFIAANNLDLNTVKLLLELGSNINSTDEKGRNLFHISALLKNTDLINLCSQFGLDVNFKDVDGNTPIMLADKYKSITIMDTLVKLGADYILVNNRGENIFHIAAKVADLLMVEYCLKLELDP